MMSNGSEWLAGIAKRLKEEVQNGAAPGAEQLTVRELLGKYGFMRRGDYINNQILNQLDEHDLRIVPDFRSIWLDNHVRVELDPQDGDNFPGGQQPDPTPRVDMLAAAHNSPMRVRPDDALSAATTLMQLHDFSQLPVMTNERDLKGVVGWRSVGARLALKRDCQHVRDCMESAVEIPKDTPLFQAISIVAQNGYVLVRDADLGNVISGIVTATDLSDQLVKLAGPFLLAGEIEGHLRNLIHRKFTLDELKALSSAAGGGREIRGSADLTLGEYIRLLQNPESWNRLELNIDRKQFIDHLDSVRRIRNSIMHFNPEGLDDKETAMLRDVAKFFEDLVAFGVM